MAQIARFCWEMGTTFSTGFWNFKGPLNASLPNVMLHIVLIVGISNSIHHFILRRLYQPLIVAQILTGMILNQKSFGTQRLVEKITRYGSLERGTLTMLGLGMFLFVVGVKIDVTMLRNSGKKAAIIGVVGALFPLVMVFLFGQVAIKLHKEPETIKPFMPSLVIGRVWSITSYINLSIFLNEYHLLNSKLGQLALSSSLMGQLVMEAMNPIFASLENRKMASGVIMVLAPFLALVPLIAFIMLVARPVVMGIVRKTPMGQEISQDQFVIIVALALICGFFSMTFGLDVYVGTFLFGLVLPAGPPLGTTLAKRLEGLVGGLYVPLFVATIGLSIAPLAKADIPEIKYVVLLLILNILGKMIGIIGSALCYKITFQDSLILSLMMTNKGIYEMEYLWKWRNDPNFTFAAYIVLLTGLVAANGVSSALVKLMYNPSTRHVAYKRRTIEHAKSGTDLRVMACIYKQENVPPIINLLAAFNPTRDNPLAVIVLHLIELVGSTTSVLKSYQRKIYESNTTETDHIVNALRIFEHQSLGCVLLDPFLSKCPYTSIHDDICSLALDTRSSFLILPFHRTMALDGTLEPMNQTLQAINVNVLDYAPCSIGILIIHGSSYTNQMQYNVALYFMGGPDDRECLALALRMARKPNINLTVVRFLLPEGWSEKWEEKLDEEMLGKFKYNTRGNERVLFHEEVAHSGVHMLNIMTSMSKEFGLVVVGRRKGLDTHLSSSFSVWTEYPELGIIGDIFASGDPGTSFCTLVVQQHAKLGEIKVRNLKF